MPDTMPHKVVLVLDGMAELFRGTLQLEYMNSCIVYKGIVFVYDDQSDWKESDAYVDVYTNPVTFWLEDKDA